MVGCFSPYTKCRNILDKWEPAGFEEWFCLVVASTCTRISLFNYDVSTL